MPDLLPGLQLQTALQPQLRPPQPHDARIVAGAGGSDGARLGQNGQQDHGATRQGTRVEPPPDPDPPTGPPPAFAANVLETEERRRRQGLHPAAPTEAVAQISGKATDWPPARPSPVVDHRS